MKDKIVKNTIYIGISSLIIGGIGFLLIPFMIAKVGIVEYGLVGISNIFAFSGYVSLLELGFQRTIAKYIAEYNAKKDEEKICGLITSTLVLFCILGLTLMTLGLILSVGILKVLKIPDAYLQTFHLAICIVFVSYSFQFPNIVFAGLYEGLQRFDILKGVQTLTTILYALSIIILLSTGFNYIAIISSIIAAIFIQFVMNFILAFKVLPFLSLRYKYFSLRHIHSIWGMAKYLFVGNISSLIYHQTPRILIGIFLGAVSMTNYEIIMKLPRFLKVMLGFVNTAVTPAVSELNAYNKKKYLESLFFQGLRYQFFSIYPIVVGAMYFSQQFLSSWVGDEFVSLSLLLQFTLLWNLVIPIMTFGGSIFAGMNFKLKHLTILSIITTFLSIVISIVMVKYYELNGIIFGFIGANLLIFPFYLKLYSKTFKISAALIIKELIKVFSCSFIPIGILFLVNKVFVDSNFFIFSLKIFFWLFLYWGSLSLLVMTSKDRKEIIFTFKNFVYNH